MALQAMVLIGSQSPGDETVERLMIGARAHGNRQDGTAAWPSGGDLWDRPG
jgi:hypothetical protein